MSNIQIHILIYYFLFQKHVLTIYSQKCAISLKTKLNIVYSNTFFKLPEYPLLVDWFNEVLWTQMREH